MKGRGFQVQDIEKRNPTLRLDARNFDAGLLQTVSRIKRSACPPTLRVVALGELMRKKGGITGGSTPLGGIYTDEGRPFLRVQNVHRGYLDLSDVVFIDEQTHLQDLSRSQLRAGDVLVTITGWTYGQVAKVEGDAARGNVNQHVVRLRLKKGYDPDFLVGYLNSELGRDQFEHDYTGSSRPALDYEALRRALVLLPEPRQSSRLVGALRKSFEMASHEVALASATLANENGVVHRLLQIPSLPEPVGRVFVVGSRQLGDRLDATRYDPDYEKVLRVLERGPLKIVKVSKIAKDSTSRVAPSTQPEQEFRAVELSDFDARFGEIRLPPATLGIDIKGLRVALRVSEIAVSRMRFYLRKVAIVPDASNIVGTPEVFTFKCSTPSDSAYLWIMLRQDFCVRQVQHYITGSSRPRTEKAAILDAVIPFPKPALRNAITHQVSQLYKEANAHWLRAEAIREEAFRAFATDLLALRKGKAPPRDTPSKRR